MNCERRSPDGDGLPMIKGLGDETRVLLSARGDESHRVLPPQQASVHAQGGLDRNDNSPLKPAAGSEPADAHSIYRHAVRCELALRKVIAWLEEGAGPYHCDHCNSIQPVDDADRVLGAIPHTAACPYRIALDALEGK